MTFTSTTDFLFVILALSVTVVTIFLAAALYHLIKVLRDVEAITDNVRETSERINKVIIRPTKLIASIISKMMFVGGLIGGKKKDRNKAIEDEDDNG